MAPRYGRDAHPTPIGTHSGLVAVPVVQTAGVFAHTMWEYVTIDARLRKLHPEDCEETERPTSTTIGETGKTMGETGHANFVPDAAPTSPAATAAPVETPID